MTRLGFINRNRNYAHKTQKLSTGKLLITFYFYDYQIVIRNMLIFIIG